ncbi:type II RES/Xre toxin-antitoxin system antitoxin [Aeromonas sp. 23P]|uniref:type II RES/Xre toxin-antitoxin system antitoxin n=1 Tax=Aeromonas sp. 23P TaxID=3452716 RepID=UPI003F7AB6E0|nr:DUF2384 domain-containing protein [Aeromonas veronii]
MSVGTAYKPKAISRNLDGLLVALALPRQAVDAHSQIMAGFPSDMVAKIAIETALDEATICKTVGISRTTLHRRSKNAAQLFSPEQSGKLYLFARVVDAAMRLFGQDKAAALSWLNSPARALGGQTPMQMLTSPTGAEAVVDLIGQIEHGVVS